MIMRSCCGLYSLRAGTRCVAVVTLAMKLLLFTLFVSSACYRERLFAFLNDTLGFRLIRDQSTSSYFVEFWVAFSICLLLFLEMMASWLAVRGALQENRWHLLPYIGMSLWGIFLTAVVTTAVLSNHAFTRTTTALLLNAGPLVAVLLLRTCFLLVVLSYYRELQERDYRQENTVPSVTSGVPPTHIDDLPSCKRYGPFLLEHLEKPPPYDSQTDDKVNGKTEGLNIGMYL